MVQALNSLGALEMETDHLAKGSQAFQTLLDQVRSNGWKQSVVYLRNAGDPGLTIDAPASGRYSIAHLLIDLFYYSLTD